MALLGRQPQPSSPQAHAMRRAVVPVGRRLRVSRAVVALVAALLVGSNLLAYHLGKDCGAWEARARLHDRSRPASCVFER